MRVNPFAPKKYYLIATVNGRPFADGGFSSRKEAQEIGWRKLQGIVWEVVESDARNLDEFTQQNRHKLLLQTGNPEVIFRNTKHQL